MKKILLICLLLTTYAYGSISSSSRLNFVCKTHDNTKAILYSSTDFDDTYLKITNPQGDTYYHTRMDGLIQRVMQGNNLSDYSFYKQNYPPSSIMPQELRLSIEYQGEEKQIFTISTIDSEISLNCRKGFNLLKNRRDLSGKIRFFLQEQLLEKTELMPSTSSVTIEKIDIQTIQDDQQTDYYFNLKLKVVEKAKSPYFLRVKIARYDIANPRIQNIQLIYLTKQ